MTQQTTETTKPDLESQTKTKDSDGSGEKQSDAEDLVKALQEAIERIETLEASNTALEARIAALEGQ